MIVTIISFIFFILLYIYIKKNKFLSFLYLFIGTIFHELLHFIVGLVLFAMPNNFSLIPKYNIKNNSYTLGSVSFFNIRFYNAIPIAFAPLFLLIIGIYLILLSKNINLILLNILIGYISAVLFLSSIPSKIDINIAVSSKFGIIFYILIIFWTISYLYDPNITEFYFEKIYNYISFNIH